MMRGAIRIGLSFALAGAVGLVIGLFVDLEATGFAYLVGFAFALSLALGFLMLLMIEYACQARWFVAVRRFAEAGAATFPALLVLALPILYFGPHNLYPWTSTLVSDEPMKRAALEHKDLWFNPAFFILRAILYFAVWIGFSEGLFRGSLRQAEDPSIAPRVRRLACAGIWPLGLTLTLAAFDWLMSLDPMFGSTVYGIAFFAGCVLAALAALAMIVRLAEAKGVLAGDHAIAIDHYYAIGRLQLTFLIFWAYNSFVQLLISWMGDLPEEAVYYLYRFDPRWRWLGVYLIVGGFAVPFIALLQYKLKRSRFFMMAISGVLLLGHFADICVWILPSGSDRGARFSVLDAASVSFFVGISFAFAAWRLSKRPLVPIGDPMLPLALRYISS